MAHVTEPASAAAPAPMPRTLTLEEVRLDGKGRACSVGAGVAGSVCCGGGIVAAVATGLGAAGVVGFTRSWGGMQGLTLLSAFFAIALVVGVALFTTRHARRELPRDAYPAVLRRSLFRIGSWALAGYAVYFIGVNAVLNAAGFQYLKTG